MGGAAAPSAVVVDAVGYAGGAVLALCLVPQVAKIIIVRSARDISIAWSVLYLAGLSLSITYLILKDAMAAWLPMAVEVLGCLIIMLLKLFYEHTDAGRRFSSAARDSQAVAAMLHTVERLDGSIRSLESLRSWRLPDAIPQLSSLKEDELPIQVVCGAGESTHTVDSDVTVVASADLLPPPQSQWMGSKRSAVCTRIGCS